MKHYCDYIPLSLAEKLKEKGMSIKEDIYLEDDGYWEKTIKSPSYAEVFDWLMEKDIYIRIVPFEDKIRNWFWSWYIDQVGEPYIESDFYYDTWYKATNAAIEKALILI